MERMGRNTEEKELIWLPKKTCDEIKKAESESAQLKIIQDYLDNTKRSMAGDLEQMEEDSIRFRGMLLSYKKAYSDALDFHNDAIEKMWCEINNQTPDMKKEVARVVDQVEGIYPAIEKVQALIADVSGKMSKINTYELTRMVELIEKIENCDERTRKVLEKVLSL